jgi:hypothetical protein
VKAKEREKRRKIKEKGKKEKLIENVYLNYEF